MPYVDPDRQREAGAESYRRRYNARTRKAKAFKRSESERKRDWQATEAGKRSNRERQRRFRERQAEKKNAASVKSGKTQKPPRSSRQRDTGGKLRKAKRGGRESRD